VTGEERITITRHCRQLSPKETDELVEAVADLIVNFIKSGKQARGMRGPAQPHTVREAHHE